MLTRLISLMTLLMLLGQNTLYQYADQMNLGGTLILVNREYTISADYEPDDLVMPAVARNSDSVLMRKEAAEALEELFEAAKEEEGLKLVAVSGYRSYSRQSTIYSNKIAKVGKKQASLYVAPPGASEHQLGLAMDLGCKSNMNLTGGFGATPEGIWVAENCWRFGFIIRYKEEWTDITGYAYEPWHIRYVGREHAKIIYELDIPFETYISQLRAAQYQMLIGREP